MPCSTMRRMSLSMLASMNGRETVRATVPVITSGISARMDMEHLFKTEVEQPADEENPYI